MNATKIEYDLDDGADADLYEDMLHDGYPEDIDVCGMTMDPVQVLKECDPTAYRCGAIDYFDGLDERWDCECGERFDNEQDAEECCMEPEEILEMDLLKAGKRQV